MHVLEDDNEDVDWDQIEVAQGARAECRIVPHQVVPARPRLHDWYIVIPPPKRRSINGEILRRSISDGILAAARMRECKARKKSPLLRKLLTKRMIFWNDFVRPAFCLTIGLKRGFRSWVRLLFTILEKRYGFRRLQC